MSSRASGRKNPARDSPEAATGEDAGYGASQRTQGVPSPIPGGRQHVTRAPAVREKVPTGVPRNEYHGILAHGVHPGTGTTMDRADAIRGITGPKPAPLEYAQREPVLPVPVYVVPVGGGDHPLNTAYTAKFDVPAMGLPSDPIKIAGRDVNRTRLRIRNIGSAEVAIARDPAHLIPDAVSTTTTVGGAQLGTAMTGYQDINTSGEVWAISASPSTAATIYVIYETATIGGV